MSKPETTYPCDECERVVARIDDQGDLVLTIRHDTEKHTTRISKAVLTDREACAKD